MSEVLLDRAGRRRSPATLPTFHAGRAPGNKGLRYPADPPKIEEIVAVMRAAGDRAHGRRLRGLIAILWRSGLRIQETLALTEADLDHRRGSLLVRRGKGGRRREVGMDASAGSNYSPGWTCGAPRRATTRRHSSRSAAPLRATPARSRPRRRDGARRRSSDRHPAPTRAQQPRHHQRLSARHRQRRDHRDRARPTRTDDPGQRVASALTARKLRCSSSRVTGSLRAVSWHRDLDGVAEATGLLEIDDVSPERCQRDRDQLEVR